MTLPGSGIIWASQINEEIGRPWYSRLDLNGTPERTLARVSSGIISFWNFYNKSAWRYFRFSCWGVKSGTEVQFAEVRVFNTAGTNVLLSKTPYYNTSGTLFGDGAYAHATDGNIGTKFGATATGFDIRWDLGSYEVLASADWFTANDMVGRDPYYWDFSLSRDGASWVQVVLANPWYCTDSRNTQTGTWIMP